MFNKIIVGIDGTDGAKDALALASVLADDNAELVLAEIIEVGRTPSRATNRDFEAASVEAARARLDEVADCIDRFPTTPRPIVAPTVADGLSELAAEEDADLIVMGSCRRGPVGRFFLGNDASATMHHAPCAVALAPKGYRDGDKLISHIGLGFDESRESESAYSLAVALRERFHAKLEVVESLPLPWPVEVTHPGLLPPLHKQRKQAAARFLADPNVDSSKVMISGAPATKLHDLADRCELLVIGAPAHHTAGAAAFPATSDTLSHHVACPVIAAPRVATPATSAS